MIALFAALIAPWFVNWNDYKGTFEAEAGRILGQPVTVVGSASASILPSPSLTFGDVRVGDVDGKPMMTVDRFEVTIELMPLLQGEIRVVSMKLRRPVVTVMVDDSGGIDWLARNEASQTLDPDKVILENVAITDGEIDYSDVRAGISRKLEKVNAEVEARSLSGPWRVDGSFLDHGQRVPFRLSTGRRAESGAIRLKTELTPANWPVTLVADGDINSDADGIFYTGTYSLAEVVPAETNGADHNTGWRSEGAFTLTRDRLVIDKAVLSEGPVERPYSVAGSLAIQLGAQPQFDAALVARQLDLDRSLGSGPTAPVDPAAAAESLVTWLGTLYVPPMHGKVSFSVPGIIVGGAVIQDTSFRAEPGDSGWRISNLRASLPGQASLEASGRLSTGDEVGFNGDIHLIVQQPATFAAWWRGKSEQGAGRMLAPFDLSGRALIAPGQVAVDALSAKVGDSTIRGRFAWTEAKTEGRPRHLGTDLTADRIDSTQLRALSELLVGKDLADTGLVADSYAVKLAARSLVIDDLSVGDVVVDASFADDALTVNEFRIGDIGGASINVTQGRIDNPVKSPRGQLEAKISAPDSLEGLATVVDSVLPESVLATWLKKAAPAMVPAVLNAKIEAPPADGKADFRATIRGIAASTTLAAAIDLTGSPQEWRNGKLDLSVNVETPEAIGLARQAGIDVTDVAALGGSRVKVSAAGVPSAGLDVDLAGDYGGLKLESAGKLALPADAPATYAGKIKAQSADLNPLLAMADVDVPGMEGGTALNLDGTIATDGPAATVAWNGGTFGDRATGGNLTVRRSPAGKLALAGELTLDEVDLPWITALGLGYPLEPTGDRFSPWSKAPFTEPKFGQIGGKIAVTAERLRIAEGFEVSKARFGLDLDPAHINIDLSEGGAFGGVITGGLSMSNVGGNTNVSGRVELKEASLDSVVWEQGGRPVVTGSFDLSSSFDATGRSPAALIASLTGGGTVALRNGEVRRLNPRAVALIVRASDLGQEYSDETLQAAFASYIDGGSLKLDEASGAFSIAAGTARVKSLAVAADGVSATGGASIDLNTLDLDSDWTLTFDVADDRAKGTVPQVGMVFRGPLAEPTRILDVVQFGAYLNIRQEERIQEILNLEQADRAEKEKLNRLKRRLREDAARRQRDQELAIASEDQRRQAAIEAVIRLEDFHNLREGMLTGRASASVAVARADSAVRAATNAAEAAERRRQAAESRAAAASERAASAKALAKDATIRLATARDARGAAAKAFARVTAERDAAAKDSAAAAAQAETAQAAVSSATRDAANKSAAEAAARKAAAEANAAKAAADKFAGDKAALQEQATTAADAAADEDANAAESAAEKAGAAEQTRRVSEKADAGVVRALANEATARKLVDNAAEKVATTAAAKQAAEEAARTAQTASIEPGDAATTSPPPQVDLVAAADLAAATEAAKTALAAKAKADENAATAFANLTAARRNAELARTAAADAAAAKDAADEVLIASGQKREALDREAAAAKTEADQAAAMAADKSVAAVKAAGALAAAARDAAAAKAVAEGAVKAATAMADAADAAAKELADRNEALAAAKAALTQAEDEEAAAAREVDAAVAAANAADADAKRAVEAVKQAANEEAVAKAALDEAVAFAAKAQKGLSSFEITPATLSPVAGDADAPAPAAKPKRTKPATQTNKPFSIVPLFSQ